LVLGRGMTSELRRRRGETVTVARGSGAPQHQHEEEPPGQRNPRLMGHSTYRRQDDVADEGDELRRRRGETVTVARGSGVAVSVLVLALERRRDDDAVGAGVTEFTEDKEPKPRSLEHTFCQDLSLDAVPQRLIQGQASELRRRRGETVTVARGSGVAVSVLVLALERRRDQRAQAQISRAHFLSRPQSRCRPAAPHPRPRARLLLGLFVFGELCRARFGTEPRSVPSTDCKVPEVVGASQPGALESDQHAQAPTTSGTLQSVEGTDLGSVPKVCSRDLGLGSLSSVNCVGHALGLSLGLFPPLTARYPRPRARLLRLCQPRTAAVPRTSP
jgi:hypothetical protein